MPEFLLSVHMVEGEEPPAPEVMEEMFAAVDAFNAELQATGVWVFAGGLQPAKGSRACQGKVEVRPFQVEPPA